MPETWTAIGVMAAFGLGALALLGTLHGRIDQLRRDFQGELRESRTEMLAHFDRVEARFDRVDDRFDRVDDRFERVDARFDRVEARLDKLDSRLGRVEQGFVDHEARHRAG
jgi:uncharacterized protein YdcH (DUF465 family)